MLDPDVALELLDGVREEPAEGAPQRRQHGPPSLSMITVASSRCVVRLRDANNEWKFEFWSGETRGSEEEGGSGRGAECERTPEAQIARQCDAGPMRERRRP